MSEIPRVTLERNYENNIITGGNLRTVQVRVLQDLKEAIVKSMGPAGSNTLILKGTMGNDTMVDYSKDGNKIMKSIVYKHSIESSIKSQIEDATRYIEKTVGDGTTSVVVMSSLIFDALCDADANGKLPKNPYQTIRMFKQVVEQLGTEIRSKGWECTLDDIYNIALVSTNGNVKIAQDLKDIYEQYGMDVFVDVSASTDEESYIKSYDGITLQAGYMDTCFINSLSKAACILRSTTEHPVAVYHFQDPIDDPFMNNYFQAIIENNIMNPYNNHESTIPTVILAPKIGIDSQAYLRRIITLFNQFPESAYSQKPKLLIVTNYLGINENFVDHISQLCSCKPIRKYISDAMLKKDQEAGLAPTLDTVCDFCGFAGQVEADMNITKFIDPYDMYKRDEDDNIVNDENGKPIYSNTYNSIVNFLKAEYENGKKSGNHDGTLGSLKRQLNAIRANMVEFFIGGITPSDRDTLRDLVEDAVLNCRSAAANGVGYGSNVIGYSILNKRLALGANIIEDIIYSAYEETIKTLYSTCFEDDKVEEILKEVIEKGPFNIVTEEYDKRVLTSIESEPMILDTISKIVTAMFTANQAVIKDPDEAYYYR